jgi:hypothetical protein
VAGVDFVPGGLGNDIYAHGLVGDIAVAPTAVPEPSAGLLSGFAIIVLGLVRRAAAPKRQARG